MAAESERPASGREDTRDLGFGSRVSQRSQLRFLNRDGTFNVARRGVPFLRTLHPYHVLLTISWTRFFAIVVLSFLVANLLFGVGYFLCGPQALNGTQAATPLALFLDAFFFSVQTLSTIGYGHISPVGLPANLLVMLQALSSLLFFGIFTGLVFARFSRPVARIIFSQQAVLAPYHGATAFEFRIINSYRSQLINVEATVVYSHLVVKRPGERVRIFDELPLERPRVTFFPLQWTIVHPITPESPLFGVTPQALAEADAEFIVVLDAFDETFSQSVHARSSYKHFEVVGGARFADMFIDDDDGKISVDMRKLHDIERME